MLQWSQELGLHPSCYPRSIPRRHFGQEASRNNRDSLRPFVEDKERRSAKVNLQSHPAAVSLHGRQSKDVPDAATKPIVDF